MSLSLSNKYTHIHTHAQRIFALQRNFVQLSVGSRVHASRRRPPPNGGNSARGRCGERGDERLDSARVFLLRCARSGASRFRFPFRSGWTRSSSWFRRSLDAKGRGWRVVAWHAKMVLAGNTRWEQERGDASRRHVPVGREGAVRAPPHRFTLRALVQACLCFDQQHTITRLVVGPDFFCWKWFLQGF